ncbi:MAG: aldo/keto reductase [Pricia sp.]
MKNNTLYSRIIAGTMSWGAWGKQFSKTAMADLMHHCLEAGITTFDHADIYGDYTTEADFGKALVACNIPREKIQLISKCGIQLDTKHRQNKVKHYQYSKAYIIWSVERSLRLLKTDYLDMLLLHRPSPLMHAEEIGDAVMTLQKKGKLKDFGVSNFKPSQVALLEQVITVTGNQVEFSLTQNEVMQDGTLDDCTMNKRMAMSWSPLGTYFREGNKVSDSIEKALEPMLTKYNATADQLLLAWVLKHPAQIHPVVGSTTKSRLEAAVRATEIHLDLQDWFILLEASKGNEVP